MEYQKMDYLSLLKKQPPGREALIFAGRRYTYGMLVREAEELRDLEKDRKLEKSGKPADKRTLHVIKEERIDDQLIWFLALSGTEQVPVIVPWDMKNSDDLIATEIPEQACMAVSTSGTTGACKLLFRTIESWRDYFPIQNEIFGMGENSRIFMQGSLAFTGNLNLCIAQLSTGGAVIAEQRFDPRIWLGEMEKYKADVLYLIPAKLRALKRACERTGKRFENVRTILSGSQSMGGMEAREFKMFFPRAVLILYYGASELNYITYVRAADMNEDKTLVGKPFPQVDIRTEDGKIYVNTEYGVIGAESHSFIGDYGHIDRNGFLYFDGRKDDICNINGLKISALRVELALCEMDEIAVAAVKKAEQNGHDILAAWILVKPGCHADASQIRKWLTNRLTQAEIPKQYIFVNHFPVTESGKILKRELKI